MSTKMSGELLTMQYNDQIENFNNIMSKIQTQKPCLLLGCGFSTGFDPGFSYTGIRETLENNEHSHSKTLPELFTHFGTNNIEQIMSKISTIPNHELTSSINSGIDYDGLFDAFVFGLVTNHAGLSNEDQIKILSAAKFISNFHAVFNLNFDLLLYFIINRANECLKLSMWDKFCDGFCRHARDSESLIFKNNYCFDNYIFYLHGSIMLFSDKEGDVYKAKSTDVNLSTLISTYCSRKRPYIVTSGDPSSKINIIKKTKYGRVCIKCLSCIHGPLVIYGTSMSEMDSHIWATLVLNKYLQEIYVGIYDPLSISHFIETLERINFRRRQHKLHKISYSFFDSKSLNPWDHSLA